jgi:hypothetical protein
MVRLLLRCIFSANSANTLPPHSEILELDLIVRESSHHTAFSKLVLDEDSE